MANGSSESSQSPVIPPIPPALIEAASGGRLVLFVGAGVSRLAGAPSWGKAAENAFDELIRKDLIPFGEVEQLKGEHPKKKLSIAMDISNAAQTRLDFQRIFTPPEFQLHAQIYRELYSIGVPIVTTNYDEGLDHLALQATPVATPAQATKSGGPQASGIQAMPSGVVYFHKKDLTIEKLQQPGAVIHIHGSVKDHMSMVVSTRQYLEHYRDSFVQAFLQKLFEGDYTVLFIGYGLEEEEIIEYVASKNPGRLQSDVQEARHYWLYPRLVFEEARFRHMSRYYLNHYSVKPVPFSIDQRGPCQLEDVIREWTGQLRKKVRAPEFLDKVKLVDEVT